MLRRSKKRAKSNESVIDVKRSKPITKEPRLNRCVEVSYSVEKNRKQASGRSGTKILRGMMKS